MFYNIKKLESCPAKTVYVSFPDTFLNRKKNNAMKILLTTATYHEIEPLLPGRGAATGDLVAGVQIQGVSHQTDVLISGIGTFSTVYQLTRRLGKTHYDLVINAGIAGSFSQQLVIGEVVNVFSEVIGGFRVETPAGWQTVFQAGLLAASEAPFSNGVLASPHRELMQYAAHLRQCRGLTSDTVSGSAARIAQLRQQFDTDIESMESAAVFYVCLLEKVPFLALRSISNYVENRDKSRWNIPLAIKQLINELVLVLKKLPLTPPEGSA